MKKLAKLPGEHRGAIALFCLEEMSVTEVAVALDVPAGTVKTRLNVCAFLQENIQTKGISKNLSQLSVKSDMLLEGEDHGQTR